jgi:ribosomal protein L37AE/L43A
MRPVAITVGLMPGGPGTAVLLDDEQDILRSAVCPMCHTSATVTRGAIEAGGDWRCLRCGQHWDSTRLAAVGGYAEWAGIAIA